MPGVTARSAAKNVSKSGRAKAAKNARRVEAAVNDELDFCTYGRITKTLGNKMFNIINIDKREHLAHIRGKMARIGVNDVVLLNERDYESRAGTAEAVYDIMAVFDKKDIHRLVKSKMIPSWLASTKSDGTDGDELHDLFDYEDGSDSESDEDDGPSKKDKKNHRKAGKNAVDEASDSDVDIDRI
jgi:translation initiation factor IF-1